VSSKLSALIRHESLIAERRLLRAIGRSSIPPKPVRIPNEKLVIAASDRHRKLPLRTVER